MRGSLNIVLLLSLCFLLISCSNSDKNPSNEPKSKVIEFEGIVAIKEKQSDSYQILVIKNKTEDEIKNKTVDELLEMAKIDDKGDYSGFWFYIKEQVHNEVNVGNQVNVKYRGPIQESLPPKASALEVKHLK
jgi:hypothetical protein